MRTRLSLCSPQYSPTMVKTAYVTCLADALDACQRIFQVHKKKAGVLGYVPEPRPCVGLRLRSATPRSPPPPPLFI